MKIAVFSAFHPFRGGIAQFNYRLVQELNKQHEVEKFTFKKQYPEFLFPGKTQLVEGDNPEEWEAQRIVSTFNPFSYFSAAKQIKKFNPEVFIANYWQSFFAPFLVLFGKRLKASKRIAIVHNLIPHEPRFFDRWFAKLFLRHYDGFVALSAAVKSDILKLQPNAKVLLKEHPLYDHFGVGPKKEVAHQRLGLDAQKKTLLFFGLIRDYKGLLRLIAAMDLLSEEYQLIIAGEIYGDAKKYTNAIENSSASERIHLHNQFIQDKDVAMYFSAADLVVLPYLTATQSGVTAIAHFLETPVLSTNVGGLSEAIDHEKTGYLINEAQPKIIANGIEDFFENCDNTAIQHALQQNKKERSWKNFSRELEVFFVKMKM